MLLAGLPESELRQRLQDSQPVARTQATVMDIDQLMDRIAQVREQGWSLVDQELEEGLISMAAPIKDRQGQTLAALNISGQANRSNAQVMQATMLGPLLLASQTISRMVGLQR